jgi:GntR family transcriptional regulator, vanillate catabolism transcriptional regulator
MVREPEATSMSAVRAGLGKPLVRTRLVDDATDRLRELIVAGELAPGEALLQVALARQLGISRTPLREALRMLEAEGLVRVSGSRSTLEVVDFSGDEMRELYQWREAVDGLAARLAAIKGLDRDTDKRIASVLQKLHEYTTPLDANRRGVVHAEFHSLIATASANRYVIGQIPLIRLTAQMLMRRLTILDASMHDVSVRLLNEGLDDHDEVVEAIRRQDADRAESVAREHIRKTMRSVLVQPSDRHRDGHDGRSAAPR